MREHDALIKSYSHLGREQRADEALLMLRKIASLVKPIMRARKWKVGQLAEMRPEENGLLGLNMNKGSKIVLRLRYSEDRNLFMPIEEVTDTMLHELCHNVHAHHNRHFHALWDQLRDELEGLMRKGYTGEQFLDQGHRLGGKKIPHREARRLARERAEKSSQERASSINNGHRLGGTRVRPGQNMRDIIAAAVEQRNKVLQGCASEKLNEKQIEDIADKVDRNGFRTQAEEDEANETAIVQALWELVQEDEKERLGDAYVSPSVYISDDDSLGRADSGEWMKPTTSAGRTERASGSSSGAYKNGLSADSSSFWACGACTLHNPVQFLCCDACGAERTVGKRPLAPDNGAPRQSGAGLATIDLTESPPRKRGKLPERAAAPQQARPSTWTCKACTTMMESQWWTCATCGWMKDSS